MSYDQHFRDLSDIKNVKSVSSAFHQAMFFFALKTIVFVFWLKAWHTKAHEIFQNLMYNAKT